MNGRDEKEQVVGLIQKLFLQRKMNGMEQKSLKYAFFLN